MKLYPEPSNTANKFCSIWPKVHKRAESKQNKNRQTHHTSRVWDWDARIL